MLKPYFSSLPEGRFDMTLYRQWTMFILTILHSVCARLTDASHNKCDTWSRVVYFSLPCSRNTWVAGGSLCDEHHKCQKLHCSWSHTCLSNASALDIFYYFVFFFFSFLTIHYITYITLIHRDTKLNKNTFMMENRELILSLFNTLFYNLFVWHRFANKVSYMNPMQKTLGFPVCANTVY